MHVKCVKPMSLCRTIINAYHVRLIKWLILAGVSFATRMKSFKLLINAASALNVQVIQYQTYRVLHVLTVVPMLSSSPSQMVHSHAKSVAGRPFELMIIVNRVKRVKWRLGMCVVSVQAPHSLLAMVLRV